MTFGHYVQGGRIAPCFRARGEPRRGVLPARVSQVDLGAAAPSPQRARAPTAPAAGTTLAAAAPERTRASRPAASCAPWPRRAAAAEEAEEVVAREGEAGGGGPRDEDAVLPFFGVQVERAKDADHLKRTTPVQNASEAHPLKLLRNPFAAAIAALPFSPSPAFLAAAAVALKKTLGSRVRTGEPRRSRRARSVTLQTL